MNVQRLDRKQTTELIIAINALTGESLGRIGNVSLGGVMLITNTPLAVGSVLQIHFLLRNASGAPKKVELGLECLWHARAQSNYWNGCRVVAMSKVDEEIMEDWVDSLPG